MTWQNWFNLVLGIAVVVVAFLGLQSVTLTATLVVLGVAIAAVSLSEFLSMTERRTA